MDEEVNKIANDMLERSCGYCGKDLFHDDRVEYSKIIEHNVCLECWKKEGNTDVMEDAV